MSGQTNGDKLGEHLRLLVSKEEVRPINRDFRGNDRPRETRVNERIRAREIRLIDENGEMMGVMPPVRALDIARDKNS